MIVLPTHLVRCEWPFSPNKKVNDAIFTYTSQSNYHFDV